MSSTSHHYSLLNSSCLDYGCCCSMIEYGLCLHSTEIWTPGWTIFMDRGSFSLYLDVDIHWEIVKGSSHLCLLLSCDFKMFLFFSHTFLPVLHCVMLFTPLLVCLFINPRNYWGIWWAGSGLLQSGSVALQNSGYISWMMQSCRTWGCICHVPGKGTLVAFKLRFSLCL